MSPAIRGALGKRIAKGRQRESIRSAVLFALLAAEAFANQYLQTHLSGKEFEAADKLPTLDKFLLGPRLVSGASLLDRGGEPAGTLKELCKQRGPLVHRSWLSLEGGPMGRYTRPRKPLATSSRWQMRRDGFWRTQTHPNLT